MQTKIKFLKIIFLIYLVVLLVMVITFYLVERGFNNKIILKNEAVLPATVYFSSLDGLTVSSTEKINPSVVGVMIDNHSIARPQNGLLSAKIVYEAPVEGGITRYFAIFDSEQNIEKVGPVRSARPYFIDWLQEYSGLYMHCGGSPEALDILKQGSVFDFNEMFNGQYFWRDDNKEAPHNLYTNSDKWNKALSAHPESKKIFNNAWKFGKITSSSLEMVKNVSIEYSSDYIVGWHYDEIQKNYIRYINEVISREGENDLVADSIVIQYVKLRVIDDYGRKEITTDRQGDLRFLRDGTMVRGLWKKENGRTRFYNVTGQELNLKPGKVWIQIVPKEINIKIST